MYNIDKFVHWMIENADTLRRKSSREAAEKISDEILRCDSRLGIEIARTDEDEDRTAIITAFSDPDAFPVVFRIVDSLSDVHGWHFVALKPPRGFAFRLKIGHESIEANTLRFAPISEVEGGFRLFIPGEAPRGKQAEELAWLIVETGIGEELAGRVQHLEFAQAENTDNPNPIRELENFVRIHLQ